MRQLLEQAQHIGSDGVNAARNTKCSGPRWTACEGERMGNAPKNQNKKTGTDPTNANESTRPPPISHTCHGVRVRLCARGDLESELADRTTRTI